MDSVELPGPRKRGGQRGNRNALETGRHTAEAKGERRRLGDSLRGMRSTIREADAILAEVRRDLAQRKRAS